MRYFPGRARKNLDIAALLRVCPQCLGDLEFHTDFSGQYFRCLQCNERTEPRSSIGRLAPIASAPSTRQTDVFPTVDHRWPETATG
jgi:hypothetical protein